MPQFSKSPAGYTCAAIRPENHTIVRLVLGEDGSFDFTMSRQPQAKICALAFAGHEPTTEEEYLQHCKKSLLFIEKILNSELLKKVEV